MLLPPSVPQRWEGRTGALAGAEGLLLPGGWGVGGNEQAKLKDDCLRRDKCLTTRSVDIKMETGPSQALH